MSKTILITGGSGLIGSRLTEMLINDGFQVSHLGRSKRSKNSVKSYIWDINDGFIEEGALETASIVVHLAGAGVADKRWTARRKDEILNSRVQSTKLLFSKLASVDHQCEAVIAASAIGIYGWDTEDKWVDEESPVGAGFLAEVTKQWEAEIKRFEELKLRVVTLRTGVVLSTKGGALPEILKPIRANMGAALGKGTQYMSWIHIEDMCRIIIDAVKDPGLSGVFNAVAPNPVTNKEFTQTLARVVNKTLWLPPVPSVALKLMLGEMAQMVLGGNRVSSQKLESSGFKFLFPELQTAQENILTNEY